MNECAIDSESRSDVDLKGKKTGAKGRGRYFESPHFRPLILRWSINKGPMQRWHWGDPTPQDLADHIRTGGLLRGFNVAFERGTLEWLALHLGWPKPALAQYRCTAAECAAMALPRSLEGAADALGTGVPKDPRGKALIQKFSIPRKPRADEDPCGVYFNEPHEFPAEFEEFSAYCAADVLAEQAITKRTFRLSPYEQQVYVLDQIINDRGIRIDRASCVAAVKLAARALEKLDDELRTITDGYVRRVTDVARLVEWVQEQGISLDSAQKADITELIGADDYKGDLPAHVVRALQIRQQGGKSSVSKFQAMLDYASPIDDRMRHLFVYHAASTGRWQSRGFNNFNLPRPRKIFDDAKLNQARTFEAIRTGDPDVLEAMYGRKLGSPMHFLSDSIRGFEWAAPGCEFIQADYKSIEGVVIAWTSGEEWKLKAIREIFADDTLPDMYQRTAAGIMNVPIAQLMKGAPLYHLRQGVGKVPELALSYSGGVAAFVDMARGYGVDLNALFEPVWKAADAETRERAAKRYASSLKRNAYRTDTLSREAWLACEVTKIGWREQNAAIAAGWKTREAAIRDAIRNPGVTQTALKMRYLVKNGFLVTQLPSGRCLFYASPRLKDQVKIDVYVGPGEWEEAEPMDRDQAERLERLGEVRIKGASSPAITALGVDKSGKKMQREYVHGGIFAENDTQAIARDILVNGMLKAESAGYPIVCTTYDEILAELPRGVGNLQHFEQLICELPDWAEGLPLKADGWAGKRYRKA